MRGWALSTTSRRASREGGGVIIVVHGVGRGRGARVVHEDPGYSEGWMHNT